MVAKSKRAMDFERPVWSKCQSVLCCGDFLQCSLPRISEHHHGNWALHIWRAGLWRNRLLLTEGSGNYTNYAIVYSYLNNHSIIIGKLRTNFLGDFLTLQMNKRAKIIYELSLQGHLLLVNGFAPDIMFWNGISWSGVKLPWWRKNGTRGSAPFLFWGCFDLSHWCNGRSREAGHCFILLFGNICQPVKQLNSPLSGYGR